MIVIGATKYVNDDKIASSDPLNIVKVKAFAPKYEASKSADAANKKSFDSLPVTLMIPTTIPKMTNIAWMTCD